MTATIAIGGFAALLLAIAAFAHLYWAVRNATGSASTVPTREDGSPLFRPSRIGTALVGTALLFVVAIMAIQMGTTTSPLPAWLTAAACWGFAVIFLARAIGDFRYVGFFKRARRSRFGRLDTLYYAPLCLFLAAACALIAW